MLSRRNVRIKVMQILYSLSRDKNLDLDGVLHQYRDYVRKSFELYLFTLYVLIRIAEFAKQDAAKRLSKLLPSDDDKRFTAKLSDNPCIASLINNDGLNRLFRAYKMDKKTDDDAIRHFYTEFSKTEDYKQYVYQENSTDEDHRNVLLALFKHCQQSEMFNEFIEDQYPLWVDDESLIVGALKKTLKALPVEADFFESYRPADETVREFGEQLLSQVIREDDKLLEMIEPTLKNWDAERVAIIDMILLKMALCELMSFPTIPTKVTLNEFVEISKMYSTEKSKDFINGILDRLMKKLQSEGKINKEGRGLVDE
jgi:N utilization substance protein B